MVTAGAAGGEEAEAETDGAPRARGALGSALVAGFCIPVPAPGKYRLLGTFKWIQKLFLNLFCVEPIRPSTKYEIQEAVNFACTRALKGVRYIIYLIYI